MAAVAQQSSGKILPDTSDAEEYALLLEDHWLYNRTFFPRVFRQADAPFHRLVDETLWAGHRYVGIAIFRDGAKTTRIRSFLSKRVAFGVSRTILLISNTETKAQDSLRWLKQQVENNSVWTEYFGLSAGSKWGSEHIEILNANHDCKINILAAGFRGQLRGINIGEDNYRPDLIVADDIDDEDSTNTPEQCEKYRKLFFGALQNTLAPASENPNAMLCVLQTPLQHNDIIDTISKDPLYRFVRTSVFNPDGTSSWPARWPTEELVTEKKAAIQRGTLSTWMREKECTLVSDEGADFKVHAQEYEVLPTNFVRLRLGVDPASSETRRADYMAFNLSGITPDNQIYAIAHERVKTSDIEAQTDVVWRLIDRMEALEVGDSRITVEGTAYQRVLATMLRTQMAQRGRWYDVDVVDDKRKKRDRIKQNLTAPLNAGNVYLHPSMVHLAAQIATYPDVEHDDDIDAFSLSVGGLQWRFSFESMVPISNVNRATAKAALTPTTARIIPLHSTKHQMARLMPGRFSQGRYTGR